MRSSLVCVAAALGGPLAAHAEPAPRSLDQALTQTLSLGSAAGCGPAFGIPASETDTQLKLDTFLAKERDEGRLGKEVAAICGSSAVSSSAALGGSLGSVQTTKTVSQFKLTRLRADSRLDASGKRKAMLDKPMLLAQLGSPTGTTGSDPLAEVTGPGVFVQAEHERRDRVTTPLEAGYRAKAGDLLVGVDYATRDGVVAGAWIGWRNVDADYRATSPLINTISADFGASLDAATQAALCRVGPGGGFRDEGGRLGTFVARRFGDAFADIALQYSRRRYDYRRNVCAVESSSNTITPDPNSVSGFSSGGTEIDDIYAGTISGSPKLRELAVSARAGIDFSGERWTWGPRVSLTWLRTRIGAYTESGRTSVTNTVESNNAAVLTTPRAAGDPTGLELAFDPRRRTSLQSELQLVVGWHHETAFGAIVPRLSLSWLHEFKGERETITARMAQDRRAQPTTIAFTTDAVDRDKALVALGLALVRGNQFAADVEVSRLFGDDRFDSTKFALQAHWRY